MSLNLNDDLYIESGNTSAQDIPLGANTKEVETEMKTTGCSLQNVDNTVVTNSTTLSDTGGSGGSGGSETGSNATELCYKCAVNAVSNSAVYGASEMTENENVVSCQLDGSSSSSTTTNYYYFTFNVSPSSATISYNFGDTYVHRVSVSSGDTVSSSAKTIYYSASVLGYETVTGLSTNYQSGKTNAKVITFSADVDFTGYTFNAYVRSYDGSNSLINGQPLSGVSIYEGIRANKNFPLATTSSGGSATFTSLLTSSMTVTLVKDGYITQTETLNADRFGYFISMTSPTFTLPYISDTSSGNPMYNLPLIIQSGDGSTFWTGYTRYTSSIQNFKDSLNNYIAKDSYPTDLTAIISAHHFSTRECSVEFTGPSSAKTVTFDGLTDVVMDRQQKVCMTWEDFGLIFDCESETESAVGSDRLNKVIINGKVDDSTYLGEYVSQILDGDSQQLWEDDELSGYLLDSHDVIFYDSGAWDIADKKGLVFEYCFLPNTSLWLTITQGQSHTLNCSAQTVTSTVYSSSIWTASTTASWITVNTTTGLTGTGDLSFSVTAAATGNGARKGVITVKNDNFTRDISVTQSLTPQTVSKYGSYYAYGKELSGQLTYEGEAINSATDETLVATITFDRTAVITTFNCPSTAVYRLNAPSVGDPYVAYTYTLKNSANKKMGESFDGLGWQYDNNKIFYPTMTNVAAVSGATYYLYAKMIYQVSEGNIGSSTYDLTAQIHIVGGTYEYTYDS
jgi:hypothetical protein